jgi:hypothetical protein
MLRNLCYQIAQEKPGQWREVCEHTHALFGVALDGFEYITERGEICPIMKCPAHILICQHRAEVYNKLFFC